jgi:hypothetical protein
MWIWVFIGCGIFLFILVLTFGGCLIFQCGKNKADRMLLATTTTTTPEANNSEISSSKDFGQFTMLTEPGYIHQSESHLGDFTEIMNSNNNHYNSPSSMMPSHHDNRLFSNYNLHCNDQNIRFYPTNVKSKNSLMNNKLGGHYHSTTNPVFSSPINSNLITQGGVLAAATTTTTTTTPTSFTNEDDDIVKGSELIKNVYLTNGHQSMLRGVGVGSIHNNNNNILTEQHYMSATNANFHYNDPDTTLNSRQNINLANIQYKSWKDLRKQHKRDQ